MTIKNEKRCILILKVILAVIFIIYLYALLKIIIFKYVTFMQLVQQDYIPILSWNLIPFHSIIQYLRSGSFNLVSIATNIGGNIVIFIPLGIYLPLFFKRMRWYLVIIFIFCTSFSFELLQFIFRIGSSDIDDVILNVLGGIFGFFVLRLLQKIFKNYIALLTSLIILFTLIGLAGFTIINTNYRYLLNFGGFSWNHSEYEIIHNNLELLDKDPLLSEYECVFTSYQDNLLKADITSKEWGRIGTEEFHTDEDTKVVSAFFESKEDQGVYTYTNSSIADLNEIEKDTPLRIWLSKEKPDSTIDTILIVTMEE